MILLAASQLPENRSCHDPLTAAVKIQILASLYTVLKVNKHYVQRKVQAFLRFRISEI